jgi:hypothetical protein
VGADAQQEKAREKFLLALWQLFEDGVPNNPLKILAEEVWPAWRRAEVPSDVGTAGRRTFRYRASGGYMNPVGSGYWDPYSAPSDDSSDNVRQNQRELIHDWARRMRLVNGSGPVEWICDWVEAVLRRTPALTNGVKPAIGGHVAIGRVDSGWRPKLLNGFFVPMLDPEPRAGESEKSFRRRKRAALAATMNAKPSKPAAAAQHKEPDTSNSKWLILSICCKWRHQAIRRKYGRYVGTDPAICVGIHREAARLGITHPPSEPISV